jgi:hypothetical protein
MSTLNVSNITDGTDTVETGYVLNGSAKAHARWNQSTNAIVQSQNVSSYTDAGTGISRLTFTSNMSNADYTVVATAGELTGGGNRNMGINGNSGRTPTASIVSFYVVSMANSASDDTCLNMNVMGDLA